MNIYKSDTIGIIALSGDCDREKIEKAKANIEALGYRVELSQNIFDKDRYLAGSDEVRIKELHRFFKDDKIKIIICARGGYGAIRLINDIDYDLIKNNPKPFCGFSDATALLLMIYKKTGIVTYHSPMAQTDFYFPTPCPLPLGTRETEQEAQTDFTNLPSHFWRRNEGEGASSETIRTFFEVINNKKSEYKITKTYHKDDTAGILWGGNVSTVGSLCGQNFIPNDDFIFFTEDLCEPVYKIDKMFQQLINIKEFRDRCRAIILGDFSDTDNQEWLEEYFIELAQRLNIPVVHIDGITHSENKTTLPIGVRARIEEDKLIFK